MRLFETYPHPFLTGLAQFIVTALAFFSESRENSRVDIFSEVKAEPIANSIVRRRLHLFEEQKRTRCLVDSVVRSADGVGIMSAFEKRLGSGQPASRAL